MSWPKLRFAISFFDKLENVTGISAFTRTADTKTSSNKVSLGDNSKLMKVSFVNDTSLLSVLYPKKDTLIV